MEILEKLTVGDVINMMLPATFGPPWWPIDLFAVCGQLIQISGLMGRFEPNFELAGIPTTQRMLRVNVSKDERTKCKKVARAWKDNPELPKEITELWMQIAAAKSLAVRASEYAKLYEKESKKKAPAWWSAVFQLFIIADEACEGVGHVYPIVNKAKPEGTARRQPNWITENLVKRSLDSILDETETTKTSDMFIQSRQISSYTASVRTEIACVQPKGRVSRVGCSLRNLSKNLALVGPAGNVRCHWHQLAGDPKAEEREGLNILLLPIPFEISAIDFLTDKAVHDNNDAYNGWGTFDISQEWLKKERFPALLDTIRVLLQKAKSDAEKIHAVILPELALDYPSFIEIAKAIRNDEPSIEFLISGSSSNCKGEKGNCVLTALWANGMVHEKNITQEIEISDRIVSQRKHHRWRIHRDQVIDYALGSQLHPNNDWWENHEIDQREVNFFQFRKNSIFSTLICEDLARSDPVHDVVRSIAPNLLFALLMDGAQIENRWPARYASSLADDPGTSVLTFTSSALLKRVNENGRYAECNSIGLWKDESGKATEIKLPKDASGVLMCLSSVSSTDLTIDGRETKLAQSWRLVSQKPLFA
jgi:hypothetical protein